MSISKRAASTAFRVLALLGQAAAALATLLAEVLADEPPDARMADRLTLTPGGFVPLPSSSWSPSPMPAAFATYQIPQGQGQGQQLTAEATAHNRAARFEGRPYLDPPVDGFVLLPDPNAPDNPVRFLLGATGEPGETATLNITVDADLGPATKPLVVTVSATIIPAMADALALTSGPLLDLPQASDGPGSGAPSGAIDSAQPAAAAAT